MASAALKKRSYEAMNNDPAERGGEGAAEPLYMLKILSPAAGSGSVIGRGGSIIAQASQSTGARIKLSQNQEFYPGTTDRVLAISGSRAAVEAAAAEFVERIAQACDSKKADGNTLTADDIRGVPKTYTVRVLIPSTAAGSIIGRGGSVIKQMSEQTGARMQLGDSADPYNTKERVVIISSTVIATIVQAVNMVMQNLFVDITLCTYANPRTTYAPTGPSGAMAMAPMGMGPMMGMPPMPPMGMASMPPMAPMAMHQMQMQMPMSPFATPEQQQAAYASMFPGFAPQQSAYGGSFVPFNPMAVADTSSPVLGPEFTPPVYTIEGANVVMTFGVPDERMGALLGHGGSIIREFMGQSGTQIKISQKEDFIPGTRNRSVKVSGALQQVQYAKGLIFNKLLEPSTRR